MSGMPDVIEQFAQKFPEDFQRKEILETRWPAAFSCPACKSTKLPLVTARRLLKCRACRRPIPITAGTLFEGSRVSLESWFKVIGEMTRHDDPVSASQICREINRDLGIRDETVIRDKTVMAMLNKLRWLMQHKWRRAQLSGHIQVDELLLPFAPGHAPGAGDGTAAIFIAVELRGINEPGRVALHAIFDFHPLSLVPSVQAVAKKGAIVETDGLDPYKVLKEAGYDHRIVRAHAAAGTDLLPACKVVAGKVIRWLGDVYGSGMSRRNLGLYLAEFAFRLNHTGPRAGAHRFKELLRLAVTHKIPAVLPVTLAV